MVDYLRPFAPDFTGWLTKFGQGAANYDANGHYARIQPMFNAFSLTTNPAGAFLTAAPDSQRLAGLQTRQAAALPGRRHAAGAGRLQPVPRAADHL